MTNDLGVFTVSGGWMKACGYGDDQRTFPVVRVMEFPGRGEGFERFFKLELEGEMNTWVVAEGRGWYLPHHNDLGTYDDVAAHELALYAVNNAELYRQMIVPSLSNLRRKLARGVYDGVKAHKLWRYVADAASHAYAVEFGGPRFDVPTRDEAARQIAAHYESELGVASY